MSFHGRQDSFPQSYQETRINNYTYQFKNLLGKGSYSSVFLGTNLDTNSPVAIKIIENHLLRDEYISNLINQECKIMQSLTHPNVVKLYEVLSTANHTYIIQEYCNQKDLRSLMAQKGTLTESEAIFVFRHILEGFKELLNHGIIHRDIKPANILINENIFKIADFGFAIHVEGLDDNLKSSLVGTPLYMSPQCLRGEYYSTKNDIWSMGVILYEMMYGDVPWPVTSKFELMQAFKTIPLRFHPQKLISHDLKDFIERCLKIEEEERIDWEQIYKHPLFMEDKIEKGMTFTRDCNHKLIGVEYGKIIIEKSDISEEVAVKQPKQAKNDLPSRIFVVLGIFENISLMNQKFIRLNRFSQEKLWECEALLMRYASEIIGKIVSTENETQLQRKIITYFMNWEKLKKELEKKNMLFMSNLRKIHHKCKIEVMENKLSLSDSLKKCMKDLILEGNHNLYQQFMEIAKKGTGSVDESVFQYVWFLVSGVKIVEENESRGFELLLENLLDKKLLPEITKGPIKHEDLKHLRERVYEID